MGVAYRGVDRRLSARPREHRSSRAPVLWMLGTLLLSLVLGVSADAVGGAWPQVVVDLRPVLRSALCTGAGLLCLVRWRLTGQVSPALVGVALLVLGALGESALHLVLLLQDPGSTPVTVDVVRAAPAAVVALLLLWSRRVQDVDASAQPARLVGLVVLLLALGCVVVVLLAQQVQSSAATTLAAGAAAGRASLWLALAATQRTRRAGWLFAVLVLLALAAVADVAELLNPGPAATTAALLTIGAALTAVHGSAADLLLSLSEQSRRMHRLEVHVSDHEQRQRWARAEHEERVHEVRSVLAGLHGATSTLRRYEDRLDVGVRRRLEDAVAAELHRLEHLLEPAPSSPPETLLLSTVVEPVLLAERQQGARVRAQLQGHAVLARRQDLATVVSALLVNARTHAPGSPVLLHATRHGDEVRLRVEDAGPGIPLHLREAVFERGERGQAAAPGTGLGLYTARRLAQAMGGTLHAESRAHGGAAFVLTLPAAASRIPHQRTKGGPQRGQVGEGARGGLVVSSEDQDPIGPHGALPARADHSDVVRPA